MKGCKNTCLRHQIFGGRRGYKTKDGKVLKYCAVCDIRLIWDGRRCPCCNQILRTRPRDGKSHQNIEVFRY